MNPEWAVAAPEAIHKCSRTPASREDGDGIGTPAPERGKRETYPALGEATVKAVTLRWGSFSRTPLCSQLEHFPFCFPLWGNSRFVTYF